MPDRLGHDLRYAINPSKLESLGWVPHYTFDTGIIQTVEWYVENISWLNSMDHIVLK
ncbi:dTDP-glucose 4,6-dehydratase [Ureibacillus acetophenoni]